MNGQIIARSGPARLDGGCHVVTPAGSPAVSKSAAGIGATISDSLLRTHACTEPRRTRFRPTRPAGRYAGGRHLWWGRRVPVQQLLGRWRDRAASPEKGGTLNGIANGRPVSIDAVKEYELVLAPVRCPVRGLCWRSGKCGHQERHEQATRRLPIAHRSFAGPPRGAARRWGSSRSAGRRARPGGGRGWPSWWLSR